MAPAPRPEEQARLAQAMTLYQQGRYQEAETICKTLLQRSPSNAEALYLLGLLAISGGRFQRGADLLAKASRLLPEFAPAHYNRGIALAALGRSAEALGCYDRTLALQPDFADAHHNRGVLLEAMGQAREAQAAYEAALAVRPGFAEALNSLGNLLNKRGEHAAALRRLDAALALQPGFAAAHSNRGNALLGLDRPAEALASFDRALSYRADLAEAWCNRGEALSELCRPLDAVTSFERALALRPGLTEAEFGLSLVLLSLGRYAEGFRLHEARTRRPDFTGRLLPREPWFGQESLAGRVLLIHPELYLGDMIQFCRYATLAQARGARVLLRVQPPLRDIIATLGPSIVVADEGDAERNFDLHCPLMSLPLAFGTTADSVPADVPYLHADPARVALWRSRIGTYGFRIGVCWFGHAQRQGLHRSFPAAMLRPIAMIPGVRLISLQTGPGTEQIRRLPEGMAIEDYPAEPDEGGLRPFADSAAIMMNLDLVISLDSAIAHLAGALARPVWIALKQVPDWRWGLRGDRTPWYPTAELFRQTARDDWEPVFAAMRVRLEQLLG